MSKLNKIDLRDKLKKLDGEEIPQETLAKLVANSLSLAPDSLNDPEKAYDWSVKLWSDGIIEIDDSDLKKLTEFIKLNPSLTVLAKGPILKMLGSK